MTFHDLGIRMPLLSALEAQGYDTPTPIQTQAIPAVLDGHDVVGLAQTGTGKTAAFTLPLIQRLHLQGSGKDGAPRILILSPTRELAAQIQKSVRAYSAGTRLRSACITGGVSPNTQRKALAQGVAILVATPGRLIDLQESGAVDLSRVTAVVLDEADHMLDIGFLPAIRRIMGMCPARGQTLLFSATMPKEIRRLSATYLRDPVEIAVAPQSTTAERVDQTVMHVNQAEKPAVLSAIASAHPGSRIIVFTRTKRGADKVVKRLDQDGHASAAIHGNKSQPQRERALKGFADGSCPILIATDIAARGIDVPGVELVVNLDLPDVAETYVHRIGRTARAGAGGKALSMCSPEDRGNLRAIERLIRQPIAIADTPVISDAERRPVRAAVQTAPAASDEKSDPANAGNRRKASGRNGHEAKADARAGAKRGAKRGTGAKPHNRTDSAVHAGNRTGNRNAERAGAVSGADAASGNPTRNGNKKNRHRRRSRRFSGAGNREAAMAV